ncbi:MAG: DUF917 domain-containing protein [Methylomicrobium sp.]
MTTKTLARSDLEYINNGAAFFASGGGGNVALTRQVIAKLCESGGTIKVVDPLQVPDDALMCMTIILGSPDAELQDTERFRYAVMRSFELLNREAGVDMRFVMPGETGSINMIVPMWLSALSDITLVDCDSGGRSLPSLSEAIFAGQVPVKPMTFSNDIANDEQATTLTAWPNSAEQADELARAVVGAQAFGQFAGMSVFLMDGATMKRLAVPNTLTMALGLGAALAQEQLQPSPDPARVVLDYLPRYRRRAWVLNRGAVVAMDKQTSGGFDFNTVTIRSDDGRTSTVISENENVIVWDADRAEPLAMAPDLISYVTPDCQPLSNSDLREGIEIILIGSTAPQQIRVPHVIEPFLTTLKSFGYYGPYVPIEHLPKP